MGTYKNLENRQAVEKIRELADDQICLFATVADGKIVSRPMGTSAIDDDGTCWFMTRNESEKVEQIENDSEVYLQYLDNSKHHYLSIRGNAEVVYDRQKIEELWSPIVNAWFENGKDDPAIRLIKVTPAEGHYWDTKNGKLVSMLKMAAMAVTGKGSDGGIEGDLAVN